jgi:hypothetical protein
MILWPKVRWNWIYVGIIFVIGLLPTISAVRESNFDLRIMALLACLVIALTIAIPALTFAFCLGVNLLSASQRTGLGQHEYEITSEGLHESTTLNSELSKWESFDEIFKSKNYIILKKHWAAIHVFPRRDFDSQAQFLEFHKALSEKVKAP